MLGSQMPTWTQRVHYHPLPTRSDHSREAQTSPDLLWHKVSVSLCRGRGIQGNSASVKVTPSLRAHRLLEAKYKRPVVQPESPNGKDDVPEL